ncbi:14981_t:CDS:2, partial [Funneliformis geosporum]
MSHIVKRQRTEEDEGGESRIKSETNGIGFKIPAALEYSIFGIQPVNDLVKVVSDFLYYHVGREHIEIEAKLGVLVDKQTRERIKLPVKCETVINPEESSWIFESNMTLEQHRHFNELLNKRFIETKQPSFKGQPIEYKHTYETDRFYFVGNGKIRVTSNQKTGEIIKGGIVEKIRVANLDIYSPNTKLDYRISVNLEKPKEKPNGPHSFERNKDRAGVRGSQELTHELEVEFMDPSILYEERLKIEKARENQESDSSNDEVIWDYQELDEEPKGTLEKLYYGAKNLKPSKRPLQYN